MSISATPSHTPSRLSRITPNRTTSSALNYINRWRTPSPRPIVTNPYIHSKIPQLQSRNPLKPPVSISSYDSKNSAHNQSNDVNNSVNASRISSPIVLRKTAKLVYKPPDSVARNEITSNSLYSSKKQVDNSFLILWRY